MRIKSLSPFGTVALQLGGFYFFYFAMVGVYIIFMPKVLKDVGYSAVEIGMIYTAAPLMRFFLPFVFKHFVELNRRVFVLSLFATLLTTLLFFLTINNFWAFLFVNLLYGGAMGAALPFAETIALECIGKERYGKIRLWGSVGFSIIAFVLGNILNSYITALLFLSGVAFFTLVYGYTLSKYENRGKEEQIDVEENREFSLKKYWAFWLSVFLFQLSFGGFYNFFTIYETSNGIALDIVSYFWIFGVLCEIVMLIFQGPLLRHYAVLSLIFITTLSGVFRWFFLALYPQSITIVLLTQATHALSFALYYTAAIAYVYTLYTQKQLAQQFFLGISFGLGGAVGAVVSGIIYKVSPSGLFLFESFVALMAALLLWVHKQRREYVS